MKLRNSEISVVIPTYNSWPTLKSCIRSIQTQSLRPKEIIVVDNASTDGTSFKVKQTFPKVKLITLKTNTGVTGGRNIGIENTSSNSNFILFLDHDMISDKNMLKELYEVLTTNENIGIVTPKIYYSENKKRIWSAGTGINLWTGQVLFRGGIDNGQYDTIEEVQVAPAVFLVRNEVITKLKAFDNRYFATYEDTDFCFRAKKAGYKVFYTPDAIAFHKIPVDSRKESVRLLSRAYWVGRNRILFMKDFSNNFYIFLLFLPIFLVYYLKLALTYNRFLDWVKLLKGTISGLGLITFSNKSIFAGERPSLKDMEGQHLAKYNFALKYCKGKDVLEIGCGSGYGSEYLAKKGAKKIAAYDLDSNSINFAVKKSTQENVSYAVGDAENLNITKKYDVVVSFEVIEHLNNPEKLIELARRCLKKGGVFILSTPNKSFSIIDNGRPSNPYHVHEYFPKELKKVLLDYFKYVDLYGVILVNKETAKAEKRMHSSLKWKTINHLVNKRWIRQFMNFMPEYPKRLISGESKLSFKTDDFQVIRNKENNATDFVAVCSKNYFK